MSSSDTDSPSAARTNRPSPRTAAAQAGHYVDETTGAVVPPVHPATTFARDQDYGLRGGYIYGRNQSPTSEPAERLIAELEGGAEARLFASGMAGVVAVFETVPSGAHIAAPEVMYHGAQAWLRRIAERRNIDLTLFDATQPGALEDALQPGRTAVLWIESPLNPTWDVIDIAAAARAAHEAGALLAVDSTVATPVHTQPISLGADIVFHSATKALNGHSDVTAGVLITRTADERWAEIDAARVLLGAVPGPFESWLLLRGMRTLYVRVERASANALAIARHFERHPSLAAVLYPGLESHPGHAVATRQMVGGFGSMLSLLVKGGHTEALRVATALRLFLPATSLGGVESLVEHRKTVEGPESPVPDNLLRLSVGIEDAADLIADLEQALAVV